MKKIRSVLWSTMIAVGIMSGRTPAMDIWGQGEVPRITDPRDVPQILPEMWKGYESYYKTAGDEYTKGTQMTPDDIFVHTRFRNLRWEGGEYVPRSKPYVVEHFLKPEPAKP